MSLIALCSFCDHHKVLQFELNNATNTHTAGIPMNNRINIVRQDATAVGGIRPNLLAEKTFLDWLDAIVRARVETCPVGDLASAVVEAMLPDTTVSLASLKRIVVASSKCCR